MLVDEQDSVTNKKPNQRRAGLYSRRDLGPGKGQLMGRLGVHPLEGLRSVIPSGTRR